MVLFWFLVPLGLCHVAAVSILKWFPLLLGEKPCLWVWPASGGRGVGGFLWIRTPLPLQPGLSVPWPCPPGFGSLLSGPCMWSLPPTGLSRLHPAHTCSSDGPLPRKSSSTPGTLGPSCYGSLAPLFFLVTEPHHNEKTSCSPSTGRLSPSLGRELQEGRDRPVCLVQHRLPGTCSVSRLHRHWLNKQMSGG